MSPEFDGRPRPWHPANTGPPRELCTRPLTVFGRLIPSFRKFPLRKGAHHIGASVCLLLSSYYYHYQSVSHRFLLIYATDELANLCGSSLPGRSDCLHLQP
ncbi:hypothetical protein GQ53DRAFT_357693 [Thozetella sp. PMI_491]|nr:hypothetical protein GQ53DRAFT_357693 [Thozetella sp. PMI_491]